MKKKKTINEATLRRIISKSLKKVLNEMYVPTKSNSYADGYGWDSNPDNGAIYDSEMGQLAKDDQERVMYSVYGNQSQHPCDFWYDYDKPGELSMDAQNGPFDRNAYESEMDPTRGNDPDFWCSVPKGFEDFEDTLNEAVKRSLRKVMKESFGKGNSEYRAIDNMLRKMFDDCSVSFWYSTEDALCLAVGTETWRQQRRDIELFMKNYGYKMYDVGHNGKFVMPTYKKATGAQGAMMMNV